MRRRKFIKNTILATGACSFTSFRTHASIFSSGDEAEKASSRTSPFRKSIMWGTIGFSGSILEKCEAVKAAGFQGIEPGSHMNREEVVEALQATGLKASGVCNSKHWNLPLSHPEAQIRKEGMEAMLVAMEDAVAYGTDAVLLVPGVVNEEVSYEECWKRSSECIRKLLPAAQKMKINICIENVWNNFILSPVEAKMYIDQFNSRFIRFYFDCGNILVYGWPEQWIRILGERVGRIHIKEFSKKKADKEGRWTGFATSLTDGDVNWKAVMKEIGCHYTGNWLTTEQGGVTSFDTLKELSLRLDRIIAYNSEH